MNESIRKWLYATRPHTLGASVAPMLILFGALVAENRLNFILFFLAFTVAITAQISSNLANDYFGFKSGEDTLQRVGFTRLLATGEVKPHQMLVALLVALTICISCGIAFVFLTDWRLILVGVFVVLGVIFYSAGSYSLSRIGLGDLAVVLFFGLVPILASYYAITGTPPLYLVLLATGIGVWEANILVCNNYRDYDEDVSSAKKTLVVRMGKKSGPILYLFNALISLAFIVSSLIIQDSNIAAILIGILALITYGNGYIAIRRLKGRSLNKLLRYTNLVTLIIGISVMFALIL